MITFKHITMYISLYLSEVLASDCDTVYICVCVGRTERESESSPKPSQPKYARAHLVHVFMLRMFAVLFVRHASRIPIGHIAINYLGESTNQFQYCPFDEMAVRTRLDGECASFTPCLRDSYARAMMKFRWIHEYTSYLLAKQCIIVYYV